jgi:hypothetical protein
LIRELVKTPERKPTMAAAFRVKYLGPSGQQCPDAVVVFDSAYGGNLGELAPKAQECLVSARGGNWKVTIIEMVYLGPWFEYRPAK